MPALSVNIEFRSITRAASGLAAAAGLTMQTATLVSAGNTILLDALKAEAPVKTDALRDSIVSRQSGPQGRGYYGLYYGEYVVSGTRPHIIMPRVKRALYWPGAAHPVALVHHPGTKPNDFVRRAVDRATPVLRVLLQENGRQILRLIADRTAA